MGNSQAIVGNGELDIAEISLADMDPEEIRAELRRAYTQLEVKNCQRFVFFTQKKNIYIYIGIDGLIHHMYPMIPFEYFPSFKYHATNQ